MTEYEMIKNALQRVWKAADEKGKCLVRVSDKAITLIDYWNHAFETFYFDDNGNLTEIDAE